MPFAFSMAIIRIIILLAVVALLTLLLVQNWSPVLSLVFLGMQTLPLPLAMWVFFSTAAGALTSLVITSLLKVSNYFGQQQRQKPAPLTGTSPRTKATSREKTQPPSYESSPSSTTDSTTSKAFDDWETNNNRNDDWDFDEQERAATPPMGDSQTYERQQQPEKTTQSGSVYSYNYREPKNTAVGKTESVYDADYRVIIPPYQPSTTNQVDHQADDEEDWSFFEDDDFEDEDQPSRK